MKKKIFAGLLIAAECLLFFIVVILPGHSHYFEFFVAACAFLYALTNVKKDPLLCAALSLTVVSDVFLILVRPPVQGVAMTTFCAAQLLYAWRIMRMTPSVKAKKTALTVRLVLSAVALIVCVCVLRDKTDYVSLLSAFYFANLIMSFACSLSLGKRSVLSSVGFLLFIGCDLFIGLQCASGVYLDIAPGSALYEAIFADFNFAYFFYIPSQTLLALSSADLEK